MVWMKRKNIRRMVLVGLVVALGLVFGAAPETSGTIEASPNVNSDNSDACVPLPLSRPLDGLTCNQENPAAT